MNTPNLIHPNLLDNLEGFFNDTCKIQEMDGTARDKLNAPVESWTDFIVGVSSTITKHKTEKDDGSQNYIDYNYSILLKGYYPDITNKMRVVFDNDTYDIIEVMADSRTLLTKLICEKITA
jgi:SPP1 family predicted phage head-tail adaptor